VASVTHPYWPLFDLCLATPDLELRVATETDQMALADRLPDDVDGEAIPTYDLGGRRADRGTVLHQVYWRAFGTWRPESWTIPFVVFHDGDLIGLQALEGADDFVRLRTVDSFSLLVRQARGKGYGKQMRDAVLTLAFGPLEAVRAITSAWQDNHASLGVSGALGYVPNGEQLRRRGDGIDVMVHLRLIREDWLGRTDRPPVEITGFEPCRPLFGL
jgi:RimJ/RimL family protein N-acetyltransferase